MQIPATKDITLIVCLSTLAFLLAPLFLLIYINSYNRRKKMHMEEKGRMKLSFEAELLKTQIEVQEQTMQTIAADLHDNIGQLLSLTSLTLGSINLDEKDKAQKKIKEALELTTHSVKELRQLAKLFHGEQLIEMGLDEAIRFELNWLERSGRYKVSYKNSCGQFKEAFSKRSLILFRILQEIINNIIRHADATEIDIALSAENEMVRLCIRDNGKGFNVTDAVSHQKGLGLLNIQKRSEMVGGSAELKSAEGKGTEISILVPNEEHEGKN